MNQIKQSTEGSTLVIAASQLHKKETNEIFSSDQTWRIPSAIYISRFLIPLKWNDFNIFLYPLKTSQ